MAARVLRLLRLGLLAPAALAAAVLPLIALNLARVDGHSLERFREPTQVLFVALALFALLRSDRTVFVGAWTSRAAGIIAGPRFFPVMAGAMIALYLLAAITRRWAFDLYSHDFSMIDEALWNSYHGRFMYSPVLGGSFLAEHFSPVLILLVPIHFVFRSPWVLVLLQPIALWASVLPLRRLLQGAGASAAVTNLAGLIYLNHPVMISTLNYVFHMECLLPLALFGLVLSLRRGRAWTSAGFLLLALAIKEDVGLYLAGLALYLGAVERRPRAAIAVGAASLLWTAIAFAWAIPHFATAGSEYKFMARWSGWGQGPIGILAGFAAHPIRLAAALFSPPFLGFFASMLFLPFLPRWGWVLFAVPWAVASTSAMRPQATLALYYGIPLLAFAAIATVAAVATPAFRRLCRSRWAPVLAALAVALSVSTLSYPTIPRDRDRALAEIARIPVGASLQVMPCIYPALGYEREKALLWPGLEPEADYLVLKTRRTTWPFGENGAREFVRATVAGGRYEASAGVGDFVLLRRRRAGAAGGGWYNPRLP